MGRPRKQKDGTYKVNGKVYKTLAGAKRYAEKGPPRIDVTGMSPTAKKKVKSSKNPVRAASLERAKERERKNPRTTPLDKYSAAEKKKIKTAGSKARTHPNLSSDTFARMDANKAVNKRKKAKKRKKVKK